MWVMLHLPKSNQRERGRGNERDTRKYLFIKAHTNENILFSELISKNSKEKNGTKFMTSNLEKKFKLLRRVHGLCYTSVPKKNMCEYSLKFVSDVNDLECNNYVGIPLVRVQRENGRTHTKAISQTIFLLCF